MDVMPATDAGLPTSTWLAGLPPGTFFWGRDVPGNPPTTRAVLSKRAANPASGIKRVAQGLYWKGYPEGHPRHFSSPSELKAGLVYAGEGAGFAGWRAVCELMWAHQSPCISECAVVGRRLRPPAKSVRYVRRRNQRRKQLTWLEVSILEALAMERFIECPWDERMHRLRSGQSGWSVGGSGVLRPERVVWAAETDDLHTQAMTEALTRIQDELPERVEPCAPGLEAKTAA